MELAKKMAARMRGRASGLGGNVWKEWKMQNWMNRARPMMIAMRMVKGVMEFKMLVVFVRRDFVKFHVSKTKLSVFNEKMLLAGCGIMGAFFKTECGTCDSEGCEDEGVCKWMGGKCKEKSGVARILVNPAILVIIILFYTSYQ